MQAALDRLAPLASGLFEATADAEMLEPAGVYPACAMFEQWSAAIGNVVEEAGLRFDAAPPPADFVGGRRGKHEPQFAELLNELTEVYRVEPEAAW
jgi:ring-1,2-phenylacetyl-CoA epoxidase subunit PaaC